MKLKIEALRKGKLGIALPGELIDSVGWEAGDIIKVDIDSGRLRVVRVETSFEQGIGSQSKRWTTTAKRSRPLRNCNRQARPTLPGVA